MHSSSSSTPPCTLCGVLLSLFASRTVGGSVGRSPCWRWLRVKGMLQVRGFDRTLRDERVATMYYTTLESRGRPRARAMPKGCSQKSFQSLPVPSSTRTVKLTRAPSMLTGQLPKTLVVHTSRNQTDKNKGHEILKLFPPRLLPGKTRCSAGVLMYATPTTTRSETFRLSLYTP